MIFLSWALYYAYKICSNSWGHSKSMYTLMGAGEEVLQKRAKTCKGREGLLRVYVSQYFFKGVFSHLNCWCLFFTSLMGKVKTLTSWKITFILLLIWLSQDILILSSRNAMFECNFLDALMVKFSVFWRRKYKFSLIICFALFKCVFQISVSLYAKEKYVLSQKNKSLMTLLLLWRHFELKNQINQAC